MIYNNLQQQMSNEPWRSIFYQSDNKYTYSILIEVSALSAESTIYYQELINSIICLNVW